MPHGVKLLLTGAIFLMAPATLAALCPTNTVLVSGRVENAPAASTVRIELLYAKSKVGESDTLILSGNSFRSRIPFLTQSRAPKLMGELFERCDRKPNQVSVALMIGEQLIDHVTLNVGKDFTVPNVGELVTREEVILRGK